MENEKAVKVNVYRGDTLTPCYRDDESGSYSVGLDDYCESPADE